MKRMIVLTLSLLLSSLSYSALSIRDLDGDWSNGHEGVYDSVLDTTWLVNTKLASTQNFGVTGTYAPSSDGRITWKGAQIWIDGMNGHDNGVGWLGFNSWGSSRTLAKLDDVRYR